MYEEDSPLSPGSTVVAIRNRDTHSVARIALLSVQRLPETTLASTPLRQRQCVDDALVPVGQIQSASQRPWFGRNGRLRAICPTCLKLYFMLGIADVTSYPISYCLCVSYSHNTLDIVCFIVSYSWLSSEAPDTQTTRTRQDTYQKGI